MLRDLAAHSERERIVREIEAQRQAPTFGELQLRAEAEAAAERERLRNRLEAAEARVSDLEAERDSLKGRLAEAEAGAAAMREALRRFEWVCIDDGLPERAEAAKKARAALSGDVGREMLERVKRLEAVAQAVDKWDRIRAELNGYTADVKAGRRSEEQQREDVKRLVVVLDEVSAAMAALRALEGGRQGEL